MLVHELLGYGREEDPAIIDGGRSFSYGELRALTQAYRNDLYARGIRMHDRVAIFSHKNVHYIAAYMAIARSAPWPCPSTSSSASGRLAIS